MAFKTFASGVLTSSDVNTFLMRQAVITCTSSTRPTSPSEGMTIYETDTDLYQLYTGTAWVDVARNVAGAWQAYTPTYANVTVGNGTNLAYFTRIGRIVFLRAQLTLGSTSVISGQVSLGYPSGFGASGDIAEAQFGHFSFEDISAGLSYPGQARITGTNVLLQTEARIGTDKVVKGGMTATDPIAYETGDILRTSIYYETSA